MFNWPPGFTSAPSTTTACHLRAYGLAVQRAPARPPGGKCLRCHRPWSWLPESRLPGPDALAARYLIWRGGYLEDDRPGARVLSISPMTWPPSSRVISSMPVSPASASTSSSMSASSSQIGHVRPACQPASRAAPAASRPTPGRRGGSGGFWLAARCTAALILGARPLPGSGLAGHLAGDLRGDLVVAARYKTGGFQPAAAGGGNSPDAPIDAEPIMQDTGQDRVAAAGRETLQLTVPGKLESEDISFEGRHAGVAELDPGHLAHLPNRIEDAVPAAAERFGVDDAGGSRRVWDRGGGRGSGADRGSGGAAAPDEARASEAGDVACLAGAGADGVCPAWALCPRSSCPSSSCPGWACPGWACPGWACPAGLSRVLVLRGWVLRGWSRRGPGRSERSRGSWHGGLGWCLAHAAEGKPPFHSFQPGEQRGLIGIRSGQQHPGTGQLEQQPGRRRAAHFGQTRIEHLSRPGQLSVTEPGYLLAQAVHLVRRAVEQARAVGRRPARRAR